jgi:flagellar operon protein
MHVNHNKIIGQSAVQPTTPLNQALTQPTPETGFQQVMREVQFSKHANMRLASRDIELDPAQMQRLEQGVIKAQNKGIRESLVLIDNIALVVNIKNKMVVTAINRQDQVFTNIDGAVIV